jgi:DNA-directed RNA polymerase specialized sigma subunit
MWEKGESISVGSLDALIDDEKSDTVTFEHFIPGEPDFYPELFEDQIEDFLTTVTNDQHRNIYEEFVYGAVYGDAPTQKELAEKYGYSQAQVSRLIKKFRKEFRNFLNRIDKGGALWTK